MPTAGQAPAFGDRGGTAPVVLQEVVQVASEGRVCPSGRKAGLELLTGRYEGSQERTARRTRRSGPVAPGRASVRDGAQRSSCQS